MVDIIRVYEDKYIVIVDKPLGMLSVELPNNKKEKTVSDFVPGLPCHRLDRDTSGLLVLAKSPEAKEKIQAIFKKREIVKKYLTLVRGEVLPKKGAIDIPLGRDPKDRLKSAPSPSGRVSRTEYAVIDYFSHDNISYCEVDLKTGRMNQIRAHFAAIGHPVVGDYKYSNQKEGLKHHYLHAAELSFKHPYTLSDIRVTTEVPEDFSTFLGGLS